MAKQYVAIIKDHSGSMRGLSKQAARDYNSLIASIQNASSKNNSDTIVSVIKCGIGPGQGKVEREIVNSNVQILRPILENNYLANGNSTPLFDSVGEAIELLKTVPDFDSLDVSFLIMTITDGQENSSVKWRHKLTSEINSLQASDRWTFVFRVPKGQYNPLKQMGIPEGNILEWETTEHGLYTSTVATTSAVDDFYLLRSKGVTSTRSFYSNLTASKETLKVTLENISKEASTYINSVRHGIAIKELSVYYTGEYVRGTVFYQLMKHEDQVQDYKIFCIKDKKSHAIYSGKAARNLLGLPHSGTISLSPGNHGNYDIFIQSTSVNRKIPIHSSILVWKKVRNM
jgi:hypothetical protein